MKTTSVMRVLSLALLCAVANCEFLGQRKTASMRAQRQEASFAPDTVEKFLDKKVEERRKLYTDPEEFDEAVVRAQLTEEGILSTHRILTHYNVNGKYDCDGVWKGWEAYYYGYYTYYYDPQTSSAWPCTDAPTEMPTIPQFGLESGFFDLNPGVDEYELAKDGDDDGSNYKVGKYQIQGVNFKAKDFDVDGSGHGDNIITKTVPANDEQGNPVPFGEWEGLNLKVDDSLGLMCQVIYDIDHDADLTQLFGDWFGCTEEDARRRALVMWLGSDRKMPGKRVKAIYERIVKMQERGNEQRTRLLSSYADGQNNL